MKQPCNIEIPLTKRFVIVMYEIFEISFVGNNKSYKTSVAEFSLLIKFSLDMPQGKNLLKIQFKSPAEPTVLTRNKKSHQIVLMVVNKT